MLTLFLYKIGGPWEILTPDPPLARRMLSLAELTAQNWVDKMIVQQKRKQHLSLGKRGEPVIMQALARRKDRLKNDKRFRERIVRWAAFQRDKKAKLKLLVIRGRAITRPMHQVKRKLAQHGLTVADYIAMLEAQNYSCAACRSQSVGDKRATDDFSWHIDHDHTSGTVRGLLCLTCNIALGFVNDDRHRLQCLISYLTAHARRESR
jgi:hypothetical protein